MRIRRKSPKLGALCRWVRDLDVVSGLAERTEGLGQERSGKELELLLALDAVLRVAGPIDYTSGDNARDEEGPVVLRESWDLRDETRTNMMVYASVLDNSILTSAAKDIKSRFRIIETTPGLERKPPNVHPAILHASQDNTISFSSNPPKTTRHTHPIVPNLHLLRDVLSPEECTQIIAAAESIGLTPDVPIRVDGGESSILAHNFYWIVDNAFCMGLWDRVKAFVPDRVAGKQVRGLNRRFRVYRYVPGAEYRAHIGKPFCPSSLCNYISLRIANT